MAANRKKKAVARKAARNNPGEDHEINKPGARIYSMQERDSMDIDYVPPAQQKRVSVFMRLSMWGLFAFVVLSELLAQVKPLDSVVVYVIQLIFMAAFAALFSEMCAKLALKIDKNLDFAWAIGFLFGLIGFAVYGLYYFAVKRKDSRSGIGKKKGDKAKNPASMSRKKRK